MPPPPRRLLAGLLLIAQRPFKPGDFVVITSDKIKVEGTVEAIDSRLVYLREEGAATSSEHTVIKHIMIPTSVVYNSVITLTEKRALPRPAVAASPEANASSSASACRPT